MAKKVRKRRAWTAEQVRTLKTMARKKKTASRIAQRLKRTEGATRQKAFSMGVSLELSGLSWHSSLGANAPLRQSTCVLSRPSVAR